MKGYIDIDIGIGEKVNMQICGNIGRYIDIDISCLQWNWWKFAQKREI